MEVVGVTLISHPHSHYCHPVACPDASDRRDPENSCNPFDCLGTILTSLRTRLKSCPQYPEHFGGEVGEDAGDAILFEQ
jgi:hypothetical protein